MKFIGQLLGQHLQRYPQMALADIYKLLHQAAMGPGHSISDPDNARSALLDECETMGPGPSEPLVDSISPDGRLARVHLRPYIAQGRDPQLLSEALLRTADTIVPAPEKLAKFCACLGDLADAGGIPFDRPSVEAFVTDVMARAYPVLRHSPSYRDAYRPAYRVVAVEFLLP
ncbi:MAG TPA: hypothetical protein VFB54_08855 [Burkholderiales bacterium]|nr:hypothetical protein [Burkholderiales bacterium]